MKPQECLNEINKEALKTRKMLRQSLEKTQNLLWQLDYDELRRGSVQDIMNAEKSVRAVEKIKCAASALESR